MELWSLMHFLMPHIFHSHAAFQDWFSNPLTGMVEGAAAVNAALVGRLHAVLRPFVLRRMKHVRPRPPAPLFNVLMCSSFGSLDSRVSFLARLWPNHTCLTTQVGNHTLMFHDARDPCRCRRFLCRVVVCRAVLPADVQASSGKTVPTGFRRLLCVASLSLQSAA